jgi:hypothetical protein
MPVAHKGEWRPKRRASKQNNKSAINNNKSAAKEVSLPAGGKVTSNATFPRRSPVALTRATTHHCITRCTAPRHSPRRLDPSYRHCKVATGSQLPPPPLLLHRPPLHHLSRSKSRRPGTTTFEFVFYSAAAIKFDQLKSPGLSSCRSSFTSCFTSSASMSPQRLCCTAPALRFLATPKHGSIFGLPHCCCSLPNQA